MEACWGSGTGRPERRDTGEVNKTHTKSMRAVCDTVRVCYPAAGVGSVLQWDRGQRRRSCTAGGSGGGKQRGGGAGVTGAVVGGVSQQEPICNTNTRDYHT